MQHIHIGYGDSATDCLKEAMRLHNLSGNSAIPSRDDFTQGPISECLNSKGFQQRIDYWKSVEEVLGNDMDVESFYKQSIQLLEEIDADEITLWIGDSCHDILASGWLFSFLEKKSIDWYAIDLSTVEPQDFSGKNAAVNLAMYTPEQLINLWKYRIPVSSETRRHYIDVFQKTASENGPYRIKQGDEILTVSGDYYDDYILAFLTGEFQPAVSIVGKILRDGQYQISDTTIEWNIRKMIDRKIIEFDGQLDALPNYAIRLK